MHTTSISQSQLDALKYKERLRAFYAARLLPCPYKHPEWRPPADRSKSDPFPMIRVITPFGFPRIDHLPLNEDSSL